jgi:Siphovirus Gp157
MATLSLVPAAGAPRRTLAQHLEGVDFILDTIEAMDEADLTDEARDDLSRRLVVELAGTRQKVDNVSCALATWAGLEASASAEIARLEARRTRYARMRERLELHVLAVLEASNLPKIEGNIATLARLVNPPSVRIDEPAAIPADYMRYPPRPAAVPDKSLIKSAILAGETVPGCSVLRTARLVRT